jgi:hypothetical protein
VDSRQEAKGARTTCDVDENLSNFLHIPERLERVQLFLNDNPEDMPLIHKLATHDRGARVLEQFRDRLKS